MCSFIDIFKKNAFTSIFSSTGNPVCVNPDKKLNKEALRRGWKTLLWNH